MNEFRMLLTKYRELLYAILSSALFFVIFLMIISLLPPLWETNDDIGMLNIFEGIGNANIPSDNLIHSNIVYGKLIHLFPSIFGISKYAIAHYTILLVCIFSIIQNIKHAVKHDIKSYLCIILLFIGLFIYSVIRPQFTIFQVL